MRCILPDWLLSLYILGFGEETGTGAGGDTGTGGTGTGTATETEEEDEEDEEDDEPDTKTAGLKSALQKERKARRENGAALKKVQRELDQLKAAAGKTATDDEKAKADARDRETQQTKADRDAADARVDKLARRWATAAVDNAVLSAMRDPKLPQFKDPDDVLKLIDRKVIDVDQDDDDPSEVEVDTDDIRKAIKALAKKKPHLLAPKGEDEEEGTTASGSTKTPAGQTTPAGSPSKFNGKRGKGLDEAERQRLLAKYPAMSRR